jgi:hypothetical protein
MNICKICSRPNDRPFIDAKLLRGETATSIAKEYGLHIDAVLRHKQNHVTKPSTESIEMLRVVIRELDEAALTALSRDDHRAAIDARKQKASAIQLLIQLDATEAKGKDKASASAKGSKMSVEDLDALVRRAEHLHCPHCGLALFQPKAPQKATGYKSGDVQ